MSIPAALRATLRYLADRRVPWRRKIWFYAIPIYLLSPLDLLPDLLPGLGWLDDLIVLVLGWVWLNRELRRYDGGTRDHPAGNGRTIDVEYEVCPDEERDDT